MSNIWVHRDSATGEFDICEEYTDAVGPDFVEADVEQEFISEFVRAQLAFYTFQERLAAMWDEGAKKRGADGKA